MIDQKTAEQDSESPWQLWKIFSVFHELAIVSALVVTSGFWLFIYPTYPWPMYFLDYSRHGAPLICMLIDFHLGRSRIYSRHWIATLVSNCFYLGNLFRFQLSTGHLVYGYEMEGFQDYSVYFFGQIFLMVSFHFIMKWYNDLVDEFRG